MKNKFQLGSLGMANSGKNSNSSQFFITLTDNEAMLAKLNGKFVCFGRVKNLDEGGREVLKRIGDIGGANEKPTLPVWVDDCNVL